jgi:hypothetical protein
VRSVVASCLLFQRVLWAQGQRVTRAWWLFCLATESRWRGHTVVMGGGVAGLGGLTAGAWWDDENI